MFVFRNREVGFMVLRCSIPNSLVDTFKFSLFELLSFHVHRFICELFPDLVCFMSAPVARGAA